MSLDLPRRDQLNESSYRSLLESVKHVAGPEEIQQKLVVVACTIRNGMSYLRAFIEHYQRLAGSEGVDFVFLDNGSTDGTLEFCSSLPRTTVLTTQASYKEHFIVMSQYLLERFGRNGWVLLADADEHFDFPYSQEIGLRGLLTYLERSGFNAMPVQMLDMFSEVEITRRRKDESDFSLLYDHFDISQIHRVPYRYENDNIIGNSKIPFNVGGIRDKIFGLERTLLTKHPLLDYRNDELSLVDPHSVTGARIADISGVFFHYKFTPEFPAYVRESVELGNHALNSIEYKEYLRVLRRDPQLVLKTESAVRFRDIQQLLENGLVHDSDRFTDFRLNPEAFVALHPAATLGY